MNVSGEYIKFEVYQNHANKKNIFNQVAIDAINFMGSPNPDLAKEMADRQSSSEVWSVDFDLRTLLSNSERYLKRAERENIDPNRTVTENFSSPDSTPTSISAATPTGIDEETKVEILKF